MVTVHGGCDLTHKKRLILALRYLGAPGHSALSSWPKGSSLAISCLATLERGDPRGIVPPVNGYLDISSFVIQWHVMKIEIQCKNPLSKCHSPHTSVAGEARLSFPVYLLFPVIRAPHSVIRPVRPRQVATRFPGLDAMFAVRHGF